MSEQETNDGHDHLSIYDGHGRLGALQRANAVDAFDPTVCHLGTFPSVTAAAAIGNLSRLVPREGGHGV